jgi:hypothetical protein
MVYPELAYSLFVEQYRQLLQFWLKNINYETKDTLALRAILFIFSFQIKKWLRND